MSFLKQKKVKNFDDSKTIFEKTVLEYKFFKMIFLKNSLRIIFKKN